MHSSQVECQQVNRDDQGLACWVKYFDEQAISPSVGGFNENRGCAARCGRLNFRNFIAIGVAVGPRDMLHGAMRAPRYPFLQSNESRTNGHDCEVKTVQPW